MTARRSFLIRIDPEVLDAMQRWSNDELRSLNGHIEFVLRKALKDAGRLPRAAGEGQEATRASVGGDAGRSPAGDASFPAHDTMQDTREHES